MNILRDRLLSVFVIVGASTMANQGHAQVIPDVLIAGQVVDAFATGGGWCYLKQGASEFQRNGSDATAVISFPQLLYSNGSSYFPLDGQTRLTFVTASTGTVKFKFWGTGADGTFSGYTEANNGQQYLVTFSVTFSLTLPNGCVLPIEGGYEIPP
jgi:hypothetical protein